MTCLDYVLQSITSSSNPTSPFTGWFLYHYHHWLVDVQCWLVEVLNGLVRKFWTISDSSIFTDLVISQFVEKFSKMPTENLACLFVDFQIISRFDKIRIISSSSSANISPGPIPLHQHPYSPPAPKVLPRCLYSKRPYYKNLKKPEVWKNPGKNPKNPKNPGFFGFFQNFEKTANPDRPHIKMKENLPKNQFENMKVRD